MGAPSPPAPVPSRRRAAWWRLKVGAHRLRRLVADLGPDRPRRHAPAASLRGTPVLASSHSALWSRAPGPEFILEAGKVHNLRRAIRALHGVEVGPHQTLSFWSQVGPPWARRGFVEGRELREGCIVPSIAGGLCQLSNALYDAARRAGLEIVERHRHSRIIPGSLAAVDHDATVMWNYVDLRIRAPHAFRVEAELTADALRLRLRGYAGRTDPPPPPPPPPGEHLDPGPSPRPPLRVVAAAPSAPRSCLSCDQPDCHRARPRPSVRGGHRAWLVDGVWPEHDAWLQSQRRPTDRLLLPLDGRRARRARYAWSCDGFASVRQFPALTLARAVHSRRLAAQGAARQRALRFHEARLAEAMARHLSIDTTRLVVTQTLLPHLWRMGVLGGRRFDVLMTRPPLEMLQQALDRAAQRHPDCLTLRDFRADPRWVQLERDALAAADHVVTPHAVIARAFGDRAIRLGWSRPPRIPRRSSPPRPSSLRVLFPSSTLGRKGAYELREALRGLPVSLVLGGPVLEPSGFWASDLRRGGLDEADLVAAPAHVEAAPRRLLAAWSRGIPVIASEACGLDPEPGIRVVPTGDVAALREALEEQLARRSSAPRRGAASSA